MTSTVYQRHWLFRLSTTVLLFIAGLLILIGDAHGQSTPNQVEVELFGREIQMPTTLPAGPTEFIVTNTGDGPHNFEIEGQGIEEAFAENLQPGETMTMQVDLQPGEYTIYCPVGNHRSQGMEMTLTVTAPEDEQAEDQQVVPAATPMTAVPLTTTMEMSPTLALTATELLTESMEMTGTIGMTGTMGMTGTAGMTETVFIQVDGRTVTLDEFDELFLRTVRNIAESRGIPLTAETIGLFEELRDQFAEQLATQETILADATARGLEVTEATIDAELAEIQSNFADEQAFAQALTEAGFADEAALRDYIRENFLVQQVADEFRQGIEVSEEDIQRFYDENQELFQTETGTVPLESVSDRIRQALENEQLQTQVDALRDQYNVEIFRGNLTPLNELIETDEAMSTPGVAPHITVFDQAIENGAVTVARVDSEGPGWIVIHADRNGAPGPVIGHSAVEDGPNIEVSVPITAAEATETLYAMLHTDAGEEGVYEFPGADMPVIENGAVVAPAFMLLDAAPMTATESITTTEPMTATESVTDTEMMTETGVMTTTEMFENETISETATALTATARAEASTDVLVSLVEWDIEMPGSIPAGPTVFEVINNGTMAHNFAIEGQGIEEVFADNLEPGESRIMRLTLEPGEYEVYCPIGNHAARGMRLTLHVTE
ncbi:MAG: cupredoxin domain-containing protein [Caldilineaceae bacterium]